MRINAKVFVNKRNGQPAVYLPKKALSRIPSQVNVSIPKKFMNKEGLKWKN